ncbi:MAG: hypothetical protein ACE5FH_07440 [Candidatus Zixiibacteriota bacterium]
MTEVVEQKKGMSKGCLISLIIVGALVVLVSIAMVTCYVKRGELAVFGATTVINGVKTKLAEEPIPGVDSVHVNAVCDRFVIMLSEQEEMDERYQRFFMTLQSIPQDDIIDSAEVGLLIEAMVDYFPELEDVAYPAGRQTSADDSTEAGDSTVIDTTTP